MRAVILAAGVGSRLLPHTKNQPKCLLQVRGHCVLDYQIQALKQCHIKDIAIVTGHCGAKIEKHMETKGIPVTIIRNEDYKTTNNAYSLFLANKFIQRDQSPCILINSDLIFGPEMLHTLLAAPEPDGMIIESKVDPTSDMVKAKTRGKRIIHMSKEIPERLASAQVIGPVKFSPRGTVRFLNHIESQIKKGERNHWFFYTLGEYAAHHRFVGIENQGYFWAEIDTPSDLAWARKYTPPNFFND